MFFTLIDKKENKVITIVLIFNKLGFHVIIGILISLCSLKQVYFNNSLLKLIISIILKHIIVGVK